MTIESRLSNLESKPSIMKRFIIFFCICFQTSNLTAQALTSQEMSPMPEKVSNNAVTHGKANGVSYVYSFSGIDSTKVWSGIHLRSFRYNSLTDVWETIAPLPDTLGKIAAAANTVKNKIYIIGGYHVFQNGNEISSDKVHIYDPETNSYLPDGAPIPVPIDDQVQAVWRDSLIFVVSGWSNNQNVDNVQIYNPSTDTWMAGTPVNNGVNNRVFGASGVIIGDTLYYIGGARFAANFPASIYFRKGYIDPTNPTNITWTDQPSAAARGYRMAAIEMLGKAYWIGGSTTTYNYDGIAYNGTGGVPALDRVVEYTPWWNSLTATNNGGLPAVMDLRGVGVISIDEFIIAGGMMENQDVTNKTFKIKLVPTSTRKVENENSITIFPNPTTDYFQIKNISSGKLLIFNNLGQVVLETELTSNLRIPIQHLSNGHYKVVIIDDSNRSVGQLIKISNE